MNSPKSDGFQLAAFFAWLGELVLYLCKGMRVGLRWIYHNTLRHYKRRIVVLSKRAYRRGKRALLRFWQRFTAPFHKTADGWRVVRQKMASTKGLPFRQRMSFLSDAMQDGFHTNAGLVRSVVNILLPVAAAVILAVVLLVVCQTNSGVNVIYNGQVIGVVSTEAQANQAIRMVQSRMVLNDGDDPFTFEPTYSIDYVDSTAIMDEYQLADQIIRLSGDAIAEGEGLYVDGRFFGATQDLGTIQPVLDQLLDSQRTGAEDEEVAFAQSVEVVTGLYPTANLQSGEDLAAAITGTRRKTPTTPFRWGYPVRCGGCAGHQLRSAVGVKSRLRSASKLYLRPAAFGDQSGAGAFGAGDPHHFLSAGNSLRNRNHQLFPLPPGHQ